LPASVPAATPAVAAIEKGTFRFADDADSRDVPARYRLKSRSFTYELERKTTIPCLHVSVYRLRFPSPVKSASAENNTVHAEYYRPKGKGPFPAVIVLGILDGNQIIPRQMAAYFASEGVAGLFVHMAYYGPRRPATGKVRLLSTNLPRTVAGVTQTVLDLRVASAWMASRAELDSKRLGIVGTSLGSF